MHNNHQLSPRWGRERNVPPLLILQWLHKEHTHRHKKYSSPTSINYAHTTEKVQVVIGRLQVTWCSAKLKIFFLVDFTLLKTERICFLYIERIEYVERICYKNMQKEQVPDCLFNLKKFEEAKTITKDIYVQILSKNLFDVKSEIIRSFIFALPTETWASTRQRANRTAQQLTCYIFPW